MRTVLRRRRGHVVDGALVEATLGHVDAKRRSIADDLGDARGTDGRRCGYPRSPRASAQGMVRVGERSWRRQSCPAEAMLVLEDAHELGDEPDGCR